MYLDTRDLVEKREELKEQILDSFLETFEHYTEQTETFDDILFDEEEIQSWKADWQEELDEIAEIDRVEDEVESYGGDGFEFGTTLIEETEFEEYCEEFIEECGYISSDMPSWIIIDWRLTAGNMRQDYTEVEYQGKTYLFR